MAIHNQFEATLEGKAWTAKQQQEAIERIARPLQSLG